MQEDIRRGFERSHRHSHVILQLAHTTGPAKEAGKCDPYVGGPCVWRGKLQGYVGASTAPPLRKSSPRELSRWVVYILTGSWIPLKAANFVRPRFERFFNYRANCFAVCLKPRGQGFRADGPGMLLKKRVA